jgi:hypothetical protein
MKLWPEWAERMAQDPPPGVSPSLQRVFARYLGFLTVLLVSASAGAVLIGLVFLILVLTGQV